VSLNGRRQGGDDGLRCLRSESTLLLDMHTCARVLRHAHMSSHTQDGLEVLRRLTERSWGRRAVRQVIQHAQARKLAVDVWQRVSEGGRQAADRLVRVVAKTEGRA
jgi:hypothetical protein